MAAHAYMLASWWGLACGAQPGSELEMLEWSAKWFAERANEYASTGERPCPTLSLAKSLSRERR